MLVRLFGSNFRSFKKQFELSMLAADLRRKEDSDRGVIEIELSGIDEPFRLLRTVAIFGPNASGKSTILTAARALRWMISSSSAAAKPDASIPRYEPFLLDDRSSTEATHLGCDVVSGKLLIRYELSFKSKTIETESLTILNDEERGEVKLIDRNAGQPISGDLIVKSEVNRLYVKEMQPNVAVISKLAQHGPQQGDESVIPFYRPIRRALQYEDYCVAAGMQKIDSDDERFADDESYREWVMKHLIRPSDVGIRDVKTRRENMPEGLREHFAKIESLVNFPEKRVVVTFEHEGTSHKEIEFEDESAGTKKLFNIANDWWKLAKSDISLFADELSASLHPKLLDRLIRAVNDSTTAKSQLVFTTHDTGLMEGRDGLPPALRRDQIYFTKKNPNGVSELFSLAEFKENARPVHNIRKRYLSGLYGAIPSVEQVSL